MKGFALPAMTLAAAAVLLPGCAGGSGTETAATTPVKEETTTAAKEETSAAETEATLRKEQYAVDAHQGCPKRSRPPGDLQVGLDEWESPEIAGILMATRRGDFADSDLKADASVAVGPQIVIPYVLEGVDDIGISHEPEVLRAKAEGAPIVVVGSLVSQPTAALIWLHKSKIGGIADLKGKTIGVPGLPFQELFLQKALAKGGLAPGEVKLESMGDRLVNELVAGNVDAILGRSNLQGAELKTRGLDPVITPIKDLGIPGYEELVLIAQTKCASRRPQIFRKFLSALSRGTAAAVEDPEEALETLMAAEEANPKTGRKAMEAQLDATLPLISRAGDVSRAQARRLESWMHEEGVIQRKVPLRPLLSFSP